MFFGTIIIIIFGTFSGGLLAMHGFITPSGDMKLILGEYVNLSCNINKDSPLNNRVKENNTFLQFRYSYNQTDIILKKVENQTSLTINHKPIKPVFRALYVCEIFNDPEVKTAVDYVFVTVGTQPEVESFGCQFFDLKTVTCSWKDNNYLKTSYEIFYTASNDSRENTWFKTLNCTQGCKNKGNNWSCKWNSSNSNCYANLSKLHSYMLIMRDEKNQVANISKMYNQWENVIPDKPSIKINQSSANNIKVDVSLSSPENYRIILGAIKYYAYIQYYPIEPEDQLKSSDIVILRVNRPDFTYNIANLTAHRHYKIKIAIKNENLEDNFGNSNYTSIIAKTNSKRPDVPPTIDVGCFQMGEKSIRIYWKEIFQNQTNGEKFRYYIETITNLNQKYTAHNSYIDIDNVNLNKNHTFRIWSVNEIGRSDNYSEIFVPAKQYIHESSPKMSQLTNKNHTIFWDTHLNRNIKNFTVFWCKVNMKLGSNVCESDVNLKVVSGMDTNVSFLRNSKQESVRFALATNYQDSTTSGLFWTTSNCIFFDDPFFNKNYVKISKEIQGSENVTLYWETNLDKCAKVNFLFFIKYCDEFQVNCKTITTRDSSYTFNDIEPDKNYNVTIFTKSTIFGKKAEAVVSSRIKLIGRSKLFLWIAIVIVVLIVGGGFAFAIFRKVKKEIKEGIAGANPFKALPEGIKIMIENPRESLPNEDPKDDAERLSLLVQLQSSDGDLSRAQRNIYSSANLPLLIDNNNTNSLDSEDLGQVKLKSQNFNLSRFRDSEKPNMTVTEFMASQNLDKTPRHPYVVVTDINFGKAKVEPDNINSNILLTARNNSNERNKEIYKSLESIIDLNEDNNRNALNRLTLPGYVELPVSLPDLSKNSQHDAASSYVRLGSKEVANCNNNIASDRLIVSGYISAQNLPKNSKYVSLKELQQTNSAKTSTDSTLVQRCTEKGDHIFLRALKNEIFFYTPYVQVGFKKQYASCDTLLENEKLKKTENSNIVSILYCSHPSLPTQVSYSNVNN